MLCDFLTLGGFLNYCIGKSNILMMIERRNEDHHNLPYQTDWSIYIYIYHSTR